MFGNFGMRNCVEVQWHSKEHYSDCIVLIIVNQLTATLPNECEVIDAGFLAKY
jgi:hypothetical protein